MAGDDPLISPLEPKRFKGLHARFAAVYVGVGAAAGLMVGFTGGHSLSNTKVVTTTEHVRIRTLGQLTAAIDKKPLNSFAGTVIGLPAGTNCVQWLLITGRLIDIACWK